MPEEIQIQKYPELAAIFTKPADGEKSLEDIQIAHLDLLLDTIKKNTTFGAFPPSSYASSAHRDSNKKVELSLQSCVEYLSRSTGKAYEEVRGKAEEIITSVIDHTDHAITYLGRYMHQSRDSKQSERLLQHIYQNIVTTDMSPPRFEVAVDFLIGHAKRHPQFFKDIPQGKTPEETRDNLYRYIIEGIDDRFERKMLDARKDAEKREKLNASHLIKRFKMAGLMNDEAWMQEHAEMICDLAENQDYEYARIATAKVGSMLYRGVEPEEAIATLRKVRENPESPMREYANFMLGLRAEGGTKYTSLIKPEDLHLYGSIGLEIEFYGLDAKQARLLRPCINSIQRGWKRRADDTIIPDDRTPGIEAVSGILEGKQIESAYHVLGMIEAVGGKTNRTCGLHIHLGLRNRFPDERNMVAVAKEFVLLYMDNENRLDKKLRSHSPHARGIAELIADHQKTYSPYDQEQLITDIREAENVEELKSVLNPDGTKYWKLNLQSFERHGTIETRHHDGTTIANETISWALLMDRMMEVARNQAKVGEKNPNAGKELEQAFALFEQAHTIYPKMLRISSGEEEAQGLADIAQQAKNKTRRRKK